MGFVHLLDVVPTKAWEPKAQRELPGLFNRGVSSRSQSCCHCIAVVGVTTLEPQIMGPGPNIINVRCQIIAANRPRRPRDLLVAQSDMASG